MWNTQAYRKSSLLNLFTVSIVCNSLFPLQPCQKYYTSEVTISFNSYNLILKLITNTNLFKMLPVLDDFIPCYICQLIDFFCLLTAV